MLRNEIAEQIFKESGNPSSVNRLASSYGHRGVSMQSGNSGVGKGMESTKPEVLCYFDEETMLFLANPKFTMRRPPLNQRSKRRRGLSVSIPI
jgi:hypothetical protein